jgi:N-ethylmaleimide reductase
MTTNLLLSPFDHPHLGRLNSRVVMSAMTRGFATGSGHLCNAGMRDYYERRAAGGVGLILTEGIVVHPSADGYRDVPRLHAAEQAESWRQTVDAVHAHGTKIVAQLWHCGRISHSDFTDGIQPVSSTNVPAGGINRQNNQPYGTPRALAVDEFPQVFAQFVQSARLALDVGFDAVQLHMGHGYLVDQFFDTRVNERTDAYGGSVENRCRFALELLQAVTTAIGAERVMVRISPSRWMGGLYEWHDVDAMLVHLLHGMQARGLRMLDISCANADYFQTSGKVIRQVRPLWSHLLLGGASLTLTQAQAEVDAGWVDMVTWGRAFIANPDLVAKFHRGLEPVPFDDAMRTTLV